VEAVSGSGPDDTQGDQETIVVDVDDFEEFDLDSSIVAAPAPPTFAQGSETHDRAHVTRDLETLSRAELDATLLAYLHEIAAPADDEPAPLPPPPDAPPRSGRS
jgi:hypothetical protein